MLQKILWIGLAGALGTIARYLMTEAIGKTVLGQFPIGTAGVNIIGCLLFGFAWALLQGRLPIDANLRLVIFVGFFGAFTTFSTFIFETGRLMDDSQWLLSAGNIMLQNTTGLACLFIGVKAGQLI